MKKLKIVSFMVTATFILILLASMANKIGTNNPLAKDTIGFAQKSIIPANLLQVEETWVKAMHVWRVHDMKRPQPLKVDPGTPSTQEVAGKAPSDAIVLFDGKDFSKWERVSGGPAKWIVRDGYM